jgi:hypothetical protein
MLTQFPQGPEIFDSMFSYVEHIFIRLSELAGLVDILCRTVLRHPIEVVTKCIQRRQLIH